MAYLHDRAAISPVEPHSPLYELLAALVPDAAVFHVLADTAEQTEDLYAVLADDRVVIRFEIPRGDAGAEPQEVEHMTIAQYCSGLRGVALARFERAMAQAKAHRRGA